MWPGPSGSRIATSKASLHPAVQGRESLGGLRGCCSLPTLFSLPSLASLSGTGRGTVHGRLELQSLPNPRAALSQPLLAL